MRITNLPTEAKALDAYYIAQAVARKEDQAKFLTRANGSAAVRIQNDIARLDDLIETRVAEWVANHGTATVWTQHLDGTKYQGKVAA